MFNQIVKTLKLRQKLYEYIDDERGNQKYDNLVEYFIFGLIIANVIALVLESYEEINVRYSTFFYLFEIFSVIVFSIEYCLRIWLADLKYPHLSPIKARVKYITSFMGIIDVFSILPFYLPYIIKVDLRAIRLLRLFRLLRLLKLNRHFSSLQLISSVIKKTKQDLLVSIFLVSVLLIISSTVMYDIESKAQPEAFANIGQAMWWAVATLTTVGYGDIYPVTGLGKILSTFIALLGIGIVALPTGIISSAFIGEVQNKRAQKQHVAAQCTCPNCGTTFTTESHKLLE